ncbi:MAG TPA: ABC transporter ATP-binding protein [Bacillota bacterium]|nr:ABC transporter ATP-binding protein [Bacillota bacterium]HOH10020.1 ABC transporter ATP-binding protein [Bacillota bacterium]HOY88598.1 ABC transporter ATP-binding protein [Bacillota bacterium]HPI01723.1 ABC transporter ATP-binding protein [Bacillota bacterium]HPM63273.1 ABC transporter ATP-binding protein [Bacillota bacterium]
MAMLEVKDLTMYYKTLRGYVKAVDSVSFELEKGKALGLAGESGCGKSSMATTVLRLLPSNGNIMGGSVKMDGKELVSLSEEDFRKEIRWKRMSMVFQGAMNALNPVHRIGDQIMEAILAHENVSKQAAKDRMLNLLDMVGINPKRYNEYPHEFSGGMKQRVVIAMALACNPDIIIADEPTTALDVMVQAQVLTAMEGLRKKMGLGMILITHDLAVIAQTCDDVAIMYGGKIVEYGSAKDIYLKPRHPYTMGLVKAFPNIAAEKQKVRSIPGSPPNLLSPPEGCRFNPRCPMATDKCRTEEPPLVKSQKGEQKVACHRESEIEEGVDIWQ